MDGTVDILPYDRAYEDDLVEICWKTGFLGESLEGTGRFEDRRLFGMLFCLPWLRFDPACCFIAVAEDGGRRRAVGYILGTSDTAAQKRDFERHWAPRIAARMVFFSWWRHPESARQVMKLSRLREETAEGQGRTEGGHQGDPKAPLLGGPEYPAHLHINLLPGWQGKGLGQRLVAALLEELKRRKVPGLFLETSDRNLKAVPFYEKLGFTLVAREEGEFWEGAGATGLAYAMRLDGGPAPLPCQVANPEGRKATPSSGAPSA